MLTNSKYRTSTLYSAADLKNLYLYFKQNLDALYDQVTQQNVQNMTNILKLIFISIDTPNLAIQLNKKGDIRFVASLEILLVKSRMWKIQSSKLLIEVLNALLKEFEKYIPEFKRKDIIEAKHTVDEIQFFSQLISNQDKSKAEITLSYLRIFLTKSMNTGQTLFTETEILDRKWSGLISSLTSMLRSVDSLQSEQSIITLLYWFCQKNAEFKRLSLKNGLMSFLIKTLSNPNISQVYGHKCIKFCKSLIQNDPHLLREIVQQKFESEFLTFFTKFPNQKTETLIQTVLMPAYKLSEQETIDTKLNTIKQGMIQNIKSIELENLQKVKREINLFNLYEPIDSVSKKINIEEWIKIILVIANRLLEILQNPHLIVKQEILEICIKSLTKLTVRSVEKNLKQKREMFSLAGKLYLEILTKSQNKSLIAEIIRAFNTFFKNRHIKQWMLQLNTKYKIAKKLETFKNIQHFALFKLIEEYFRYIDSGSPKVTGEVVQAIINSISHNQGSENEKISENKEKVQYLNTIATSSNLENIEIVNPILNILMEEKIEQSSESVGFSTSEQQQKIVMTDELNERILKLLNQISKNSRHEEELKKQKNFKKLLRFLQNTKKKQNLTSLLQLLDKLCKSLPKKFLQTLKVKQVIEKLLLKNQAQQQITQLCLKVLKTLEQDIQISENIPQINKFKDKPTKQQFIAYCVNEYTDLVKNSDPQNDQKVFKQISNLHFNNTEAEVIIKMLMVIQRLVRYKIISTETSINQISSQMNNIYCEFESKKDKQTGQKIINLIFNILRYQVLIRGNEQSFQIYQSNYKFYQLFFQYSLEYYSEQSTKLTSLLCQKFKYEPKPERKSNILRLVNKKPYLLNYELILIIKQDRTIEDSLWQKIIPEIKIENYLEGKQNRLIFNHFLSYYCSIFNKPIWFKYRLSQIILKLISSISTNGFDLHNKNESSELSQIIQTIKVISEDYSIANQIVFQIEPLLNSILSEYAKDNPNFNNKLQKDQNLQSKETLIQNIFTIYTNFYKDRTNLRSLDKNKALLFQIPQRIYNPNIVYHCLLIFKDLLVVNQQNKQQNILSEFQSLILNLKTHCVDIYPHIQKIQSLHLQIEKIFNAMKKIDEPSTKIQVIQGKIIKNIQIINLSLNGESKKIEIKVKNKKQEKLENKLFKVQAQTKRVEERIATKPKEQKSQIQKKLEIFEKSKNIQKIQKKQNLENISTKNVIEITQKSQKQNQPLLQKLQNAQIVSILQLQTIKKQLTQTSSKQQQLHKESTQTNKVEAYAIQNTQTLQNISDPILVQSKPQKQILQQSIVARQINSPMVSKVSEAQNLSEVTTNLNQNQIMVELINISNDQISQYKAFSLLKSLYNPVQSPLFIETLLKIFVNSEKHHRKPEQIQNLILVILQPMKFEANDTLYQALNKNQRGIKLGLKARNLGRKGLQIACAKLSDIKCSTDAAQIIQSNLNTQKDFALVEENYIPEKVNKLFKNGVVNESNVSSFAKLIGVSSKLPALQEKYKINAELLKFMFASNRNNAVANIIFAFSGLVYNNEENTRQISSEDNIKFVLKTGSEDIENSYLIQKCCAFISNISFKNAINKKLLYKCKTVDFLMKALEYYVNNNKPFYANTYKQLLRALGNSSLNIENTIRIVQLDYMKYMKLLISICNQNRNLEIVKYLIDVFSNLVSHPDQQNRNNILKLYQQGCLDVVFNLIEQNILSTGIVSSSIDSIDGLIKLKEVAQKVFQRNIIIILCNTLKTQEWNETIILKCFKVFLFYSDTVQRLQMMIEWKTPSTVGEIFKANFKICNRDIFNSAYDFLLKFCSTSYTNKWIKSGMYDALTFALKTRNIDAEKVYQLLKIIYKLIKDGCTNSTINKQLFDPMLSRMHEHAKSSERIVVKGIQILKLLEKDVFIETNSCKILIEFTYMFLTQTEHINYERYQLRVAQYLGFISTMIAKSSLLKIQLGDTLFLSILENWLKISYAINIVGLPETIRLCYFVLLNNQKPLKSQANISEATQYIEKGAKCYLYRRDKSNKEAVLAIRQNNLIAYKYPKGQIKQKYKLPLANIVSVILSYEDNFNLIEKSIFNSAGGLFVRGPNMKHCITITGFDNDTVKFFDVEFKSIGDKQSFVKNFITVYQNFKIA